MPRVKKNSSARPPRARADQPAYSPAPALAQDEGRPSWPLRHGWAIVWLLSILIYLPSLSYEFIYDDRLIVETNDRIRDLSRPELYLATSYWNRPGSHKEYRPATMASYALNYALAGPSPASFRAVNLILNGAVAALAWLLVLRLFARTGLALAASLLFALHPIHVECVAGVVGRAEILSALGLLAAMIAALASMRAGSAAARGAWAAAAGLAGFLAIASKESGATVVPAVFLLGLFEPIPRAAARPPSRAATFARLAPAFALVCVSFAVYMLARRYVLGGFFSRPGEETIFVFDNPLVALPGLARFLTALKVFGRYLAMLVWPFNPSPDYSLGAIKLVVRLADPAWIAGLALFPALGWVAYRLRARPASLFGIAFFLVTFLMTSNLFFLIGTLLAERLLYLPSLGFCVLAADLALLAADRLRAAPNRAPFYAAAAIAGIWFAALPLQIVRYLPNWKSNDALFAYAVKRVPGSARANMLHGQALSNGGKAEEGLPYLQKARELAPDVPLVTASLGEAYMNAGRKADARKEWEIAVRQSPSEEVAVRGLAFIYAEEGRREDAERLYPPALRENPGSYALRRGYGVILSENGKHAEAARELEALAPVAAPGDTGLFAALGESLLALGRAPAAEAAFRRAIGAGGAKSRTYFLHAQSLIALGRLEEAERELAELQIREPASETAKLALAEVRRMIQLKAAK